VIFNIQVRKLSEAIMREIRLRIPMYTLVDANRKCKRRDQAITTYMKHIRKKQDKFPEYIMIHFC
jgi:hypothetical protein